MRRRWPLLAGAVACLAGSFSMTGVPASLVVLMSVATRRRWREIAALGVKVGYHGSDMSKPADIEALMAYAAETFGQVAVSKYCRSVAGMKRVRDA